MPSSAGVDVMRRKAANFLAELVFVEVVVVEVRLFFSRQPQGRRPGGSQPILRLVA